nr:cytochrome c family protein [Cohaesibacter celericrescens]
MKAVTADASDAEESKPVEEAVSAAPAPAVLDEALVKSGLKVFKKCKACHQVGDKAKNKVGPVLNDIFGREIASIDGFKYSKAFAAKKEEGGFVWDEENISGYLTKPKKFIPKNKMAFVGLKKEKDIKAIIEYLKSISQ